MDGGRRVLQSLRERVNAFSGYAASASLSMPHPAYAGVSSSSFEPSAKKARPADRLPPRRYSRGAPGLGARLARIAGSHAATILFMLLVVGGAAGYGAVRGGAYDAFVARAGSPGDLLARSVGLGIDSVTISGLNELKEKEILDLAGISARNSLLFLDPAAMRDRLRSMPLVQDATVRKLYPGRVAISIVERQPYALWQKNGQISIVSADGVVIDTMHDDRFANLPFVVGEGANAHLPEFAALLDSAGDLKGRIRAGVRVADRRWTLVTNDGIEVRLPEEGAGDALALAARLERDQRLLEKDIVALDLRVPGRAVARLSDEAGAQRLDALPHKNKGKVL